MFFCCRRKVLANFFGNSHQQSSFCTYFLVYLVSNLYIFCTTVLLINKTLTGILADIKLTKSLLKYHSIRVICNCHMSKTDRTRPGKRQLKHKTSRFRKSIFWPITGKWQSWYSANSQNLNLSKLTSIKTKKWQIC